MVKRISILISAFSVGMFFNFAYGQINPNFGPAFGGNGSNLGNECNSTGSLNCFPVSWLADLGNFQLYRGDVRTTLTAAFGSSAYVRVQNCLSEWGWAIAGNQADCNTTVDQNVNGIGLPTWDGGSAIDLGTLVDLNVFATHIWVNNAYTITNLSSFGRRVFINNIAAPAQVNVGDTFSVTWGIDNTPWNAEFYHTGQITCSVGSQVPGFGIASCTATSTGAGQVEVRAYGPGGDGPQWVNEFRNINIPVPSGNIWTNFSGVNGSGGCPSPCNVTYSFNTSNVSRCSIRRNGQAYLTNTTDCNTAAGDPNLTPGVYTYTLHEQYTGQQLSWTRVNVTSSGPWADISCDPNPGSSGVGSTISWTSANVATCTLNGAPVALTGSQATGPATYTFSCTGELGNASDSVTCTEPPPPSLPVGSCSLDGTSAQISWTPASGYTHHYLRVQRTLPPPVIWQALNDDYVANSYAWTATPGSVFNWWVHTRDTSNGAYSAAIGGTVDCRVLPRVDLTGDVNP